MNYIVYDDEISDSEQSEISDSEQSASNSLDYPDKENEYDEFFDNGVCSICRCRKQQNTFCFYCGDCTYMCKTCIQKYQCQYCKKIFCLDSKCFDIKKGCCSDHSFVCCCCNEYIDMDLIHFQRIVNTCSIDFQKNVVITYRDMLREHYLLNICKICNNHYCTNNNLCIGKYKSCAVCFRKYNKYLSVIAVILRFYFRKMTSQYI